MRSATLLMLAACSASTPAPSLVTVPARVETQATSAPQQVVESNATYETDSATQPQARPVRTYELAPSTAAALEREKLRGQVLVSGLVFPTAAAARNVVSTMDVQQPVAMRVIKDHGKIVQVATAAATDCVDRLAQNYELSVFVPRSSLVPRTTAPITKTFEDGTAFAIDRGAPVRITGAGLNWFDAALDQTEAAPPERLSYGLTKPYSVAAIPPPPGERLVCDATPMTKDEWTTRKRIEHDLDAARTNAASRRVADARVAKRASKQTDAADRLLDLALHDGTSASVADEARRELPYCGVVTPAAKLGGSTYAWAEPRGNDHVYRADAHYLADVGASCGRVRVAVEPAAVGRVVATPVTTTRGIRQRVWIPKPGPVFWPDGTKAGKYTGRSERFMRVTERESLICVDVRGVAEEVCHRRADVTVEN
jgi:hypothetical protein